MSCSTGPPRSCEWSAHRPCLGAREPLRTTLLRWAGVRSDRHLPVGQGAHRHSRGYGRTARLRPSRSTVTIGVDKKWLPIIVYGVITGVTVRPIAVDVYPGNASGQKTDLGQIEKLQKSFGLFRGAGGGSRDADAAAD